MFHPLTEIYLDIEAAAGQPGDMVAMRICSKEPLPVALFTAVVNPIGIGRSFVDDSGDRFSFSADQVIILRSPDCPVTHPPYVPVEFWGVPKGAALPPSVESAKLCQIEVESGSSDEPIKSLQGYRVALKQALEKLRRNPEAVAVVRGEYNVRPSASMRRALREAERFFVRSGLPRERYFVRLKPSAYYDAEHPEPEPKYPSVVAVQIRRECSGESFNRGAASNNRMHPIRNKRECHSLESKVSAVECGRVMPGVRRLR